MSGSAGAPPTGGWQFSGRTAMVTGAASGIGRASALALADAGAPEEVAAGITYLLSDAADFVTGQVLHVNGGCIMP